MDNYRKLVIRSLQKIIANQRAQAIETYGDSALLPTFKVDKDLMLREALGEQTLHRYLKALRLATRKPVSYSDHMTVGGLIEVLSQP
ncbi:hypothetical protein F3J44_09490 [Pantoea sp. Tr-811]|uniref:hypothetical protein n=1 Tax=Pantoea sp. Tr-811 TaxID=2608361 RepID=UPI001421DB22|nr:hypothetical protein [Pantoea sp. Tr-811]NIF26619.1 hypothetical protein [Pantoea sp. Tr-811]